MATKFYWEEFINEVNISLKIGDTVFDAGAGDGHWKDHLKVENNYISMDLGVGDNKLDYSHLHIKGDLSKIPLEDDSVDMIICIQVLEHVPEPWKVLEEFNRILKHGGYIFLSCPQGVPLHQEPYDFYRYTKHGLKYLFEKFGFYIDWMKPQKGNFSKIGNDLRMSGDEMVSSGFKFKGYVLKFLANIIETAYKNNDQLFFSDTTGYFIKAIK